MHVKPILLAAVLVACGKSHSKPAQKFVADVSPIESLGYTIDRPASVKLGEARNQMPKDDCCKEVELQSPGGGFLGRISTLDVPTYYTDLDDYIANVHSADTIAKKELLPSGAFYVEYREPSDSPKSPVRIQASVKSGRTSADCYAAPTDDELELARAVCRSLRPKTGG